MLAESVALNPCHAPRGSFPGPSRTITVEPLQTPVPAADPATTPPQPPPLEPAPEPVGDPVPAS